MFLVANVNPEIASIGHYVLNQLSHKIMITSEHYVALRVIVTCVMCHV